MAAITGRTTPTRPAADATARRTRSQAAQGADAPENGLSNGQDRPGSTPALSPEEWAEEIAARHPAVDCDVCFGQYSRHQRAALCLYGQPFGFTHEDIAFLRSEVGISGEDRCVGSAEYQAVADCYVRLNSIIERLAALLPPTADDGTPP